MSRKIDDLHPRLQQYARALVARCTAEGIPLVITQTLRTIAEQNELYAQGRTKPGPVVTWAKGGTSYHNYGLAFDFAVTVDGKAVWDTKVDVDHDSVPDYEQVGKIGEEIGLEWGGRWRKPDMPHFQLTMGLSIAQLQAGTKIPDQEPMKGSG